MQLSSCVILCKLVELTEFEHAQYITLGLR